MLPNRKHFLAIIEYANMTAVNRLLSGEIAIPNRSPITNEVINHRWRGKQLHEQLPLFSRQCRRPGGGLVVGCAMDAAVDGRQMRILRELFVNVFGCERNVNIWWTQITHGDVARWGSRRAAKREEAAALLLAANMELVPEPE